MKKLISIISSIFLAFVVVSPSTASEQEPAIAIIDTGFVASELGDSVIAEACVLALNIGCNNSSGLDVSAGAAGTKVEILSKYQSAWSHGTQMAKEILAKNPDANLVLVRNSKVLGKTVINGNENDLIASLSWIYENADKYNIVAVSFSMGDHKYVSSNRELASARAMVKMFSLLVDNMVKSGKDASRQVAILNQHIAREKSISIACPASPKLVSIISNLKNSLEIPVFIATGNDSDKRFVDTPACIEDAVSVTAFENEHTILSIANISTSTDFGAVAPNTSTATARLAASWSLVYNGSYNTTYQLLVDSGIRNNSISAILIN